MFKQNRNNMGKIHYWNYDIPSVSDKVSQKG